MSRKAWSCVSRRSASLAGVLQIGVVLAVGGSVLGFLYTRDRIGLPVGFGYAVHDDMTGMFRVGPYSRPDRAVNR